MKCWRGAQGAAAIGVIVVMLVVRGRLLAGSYFNQDDFYMTGRAYRSDLTWEFLVRDIAGHVNPLQQLTYGWSRTTRRSTGRSSPRRSWRSTSRPRP